MRTPTKALNIGAGVAKDEVVVACSEGSFSTRPLANQRTALLAFLKGLLAGTRPQHVFGNHIVIQKTE